MEGGVAARSSAPERARGGSEGTELSSLSNVQSLQSGVVRETEAKVGSDEDESDECRAAAERGSELGRDSSTSQKLRGRPRSLEPVRCRPGLANPL